jgi:hypothetical protein
MSVIRLHLATTHCDKYGCWQALSYQTGHRIPDEKLEELAARNGWAKAPDGKQYCLEHREAQA